jgi:hypothetical protein
MKVYAIHGRFERVTVVTSCDHLRIYPDPGTSRTIRVLAVLLQHLSGDLLWTPPDQLPSLPQQREL